MAEQQLFSISPEHDILHVSMVGTWNPEITQSYIEQYKKLVSRYFAREWACVIDLRELEMLLSEEFQIQSLKALNTWSFIKGMKSQAIIVDGNNREHLLYQFEDILKDKQTFHKKVFSDPLEARDWLREEGFREKEEIRSPATALLG